MLILHDPETLLHDTVELLGAKIIPALESPNRIRAIINALKHTNHELRTINIDSNTLELDSIISQTHPQDYTKHLSTVFSSWLTAGLIQPNESILPECFRFHTPTHPNTPPTPPKDLFARTGYYAFDMSTGIMSQSYRSILASANLSHIGAKTLFDSSPQNTILALTRPPGHHCNGSVAGGYCYINNAAVAISTFYSLARSTSTPTAILDLDFHHGNGTQDIYYSSSSVLYVSIHGEDEFPYYTGSATETGVGEGEGFNLNLPLPKDSSFGSYLKKLEVAMERVRRHKPEFVVVSLGFDTFELDPLGKFGIGTGDYGVMAGVVRKGLRGMGEEEEVKVLFLLEGGYVVERLGENVFSWVDGWEKAFEE
jgi:acetoin utilization deacetylase AcuC-like enzyme